MSEPSIIEELVAMLPNPGTTLAAIEAKGWFIEANQGGIYFRHRETQSVCIIPFWVEKLVSGSVKRAEDSIRAQMRHALGLE